MARPVSWLPRIGEILRSVSNSKRSHYDRPELERLFGIQPRAAGKLMKLLPRDGALGQSHLVKREVLERFLNEVAAAVDGTSTLVEARKAAEARVTRRRPRVLIRTDFDESETEALGRWLERGCLTVRFRSLEELADALWRVAGAMHGDLDGFAARFEPAQPVSAERAAELEDAAVIRREIEAMRVRWEQKAGGSSDGTSAA